MQQVQKDKLVYLCADAIETPHCFTTRYGGVSAGYLSELNLGIHRGDKPENVLKNYEILADALGFDTKKLVLSKQTHSDIVRLAGEKEWGAGLFGPELSACDALITDTPGTALAVFTADCTPILLWDKKTGAVGAVHAGWRGTAARLAEKTVLAMIDTFGCDAENICAAIGPNIGPCCFQTDADVPQAMLCAYGKAAEAFIRKQGDKYYVNLKELNALALTLAGVGEIEISPACTVCNPKMFWSHRVVGANRGSQAGVIVCKEVG